MFKCKKCHREFETEEMNIIHIGVITQISVCEDCYVKYLNYCAKFFNEDD